MDFKPHPYQQVAIRWITDKPRCALFLDMGLGKTVITLTALRRLMDWAEVRTALVVAPRKVAECTWQDEARKWTHLRSLRFSAMLGTARQRMSALATKADVYVTSRDNVDWLCRALGGALPYDLVILDELTSFKSPTAQRFKALRKATAQTPRVVGLTGTPAPNGLMDLWAEMFLIDRGASLGRWLTPFREAYFTQVRLGAVAVKYTPRAGAAEAIRGKLEGTCLSMQSRGLIKLPELTVSDRRVLLPPDVLERYRRFERDLLLRFEEETDGRDAVVVASCAAALLNKLAQAANGAMYDDAHEAVELHEAKLSALREVADAAQAQGSACLVFYQYQHDIPRILRALSPLRVRVYAGEDDLRAWNAREVDAMLAHPASCAFGLNMQQGGNVAVWFGTGWNLELYQQANARLWRQGQTRPVAVVRLACADTIDEVQIKSLTAKCGAQVALMDGLDYLRRKHARGAG